MLVLQLISAVLQACVVPTDLASVWCRIKTPELVTVTRAVDTSMIVVQIMFSSADQVKRK